MRLIDADELKEWVENWFEKNRYYHPHSKANNIPIPELYDILERMPTIEAEPIRRGHWRADETIYTTGETWCSVCRTLYYIGDLYDVGGGNNLPNYCPHCGAKMDGGNT